MCCQLTCSHSAIQNCINRFHDSRSINDRPRAGRPRLRTVHHDLYLLRGAQNIPRQTAERLCVNCQNDYGLVATPQPVRNSYLFSLYSVRFSHIIGWCLFHHIKHQQITQYQKSYFSMNTLCILSNIQVSFSWVKSKECAQEAIHQPSYQK